MSSRTPGPRISTIKHRLLRSPTPLTTDVADPVERFRSLLDTHGGDDIYGVIRTSNDPTRGADVRRPDVATLAAALAEIVDEGNHAVLVGADDVDVDVAREVESAVRRSCPGLSDDAVQVRKSTTFAKLTEEMGRAEVVIASRFHTLICGLRLGRPTVSIGYAGKSRDLMLAVGVDGYCQDIEQLDASMLVAQVGAARRDAEALAARIRHGASHCTLEAESLLERVTREEPGLAARQSRELDVPDEMAVWHAR